MYSGSSSTSFGVMRLERLPLAGFGRVSARFHARNAMMRKCDNPHIMVLPRSRSSDVTKLFFYLEVNGAEAKINATAETNSDFA